MKRSGAVDAGTPASRTGETAATPMTPAMSPPQNSALTPRTTPTVVSPLKPKDEMPGTDVDLTAVPSSLLAVVDSQKADTGMSGAHREGREETVTGASPAVVDSSRKKKSDDSVKTGVLLVEYQKLDNHGEPVKEQDRFSYQNMIVRYGDWSNIRVQVLAYYGLLLAALLYRGHWEIIKYVADQRKQQARHIHCCDEPTQKMNNTQFIRGKFETDGAYEVGFLILLFVVGGTSFLWERFFGRRKMLLFFTISGILFSLATKFHYVNALGDSMINIGGVIIFLISVSSLLEMLPYETRYLAVCSQLFTMSIASAIAALHFNIGYSTDNMTIMLTGGYVCGFILVKFVIKDSICHLNIRNNVDVIEKKLRKQEGRLHREAPEGDLKFHRAAARKIFEDLIYLDQDELKLSEFFTRLWRSFSMIEIGLVFFQAISSGIHEYEYKHLSSERNVDPMQLSFDITIGYSIAGVIMHLTRKWHRNRAICWLFAAALLNCAARHAFEDYDQQNHCATVHFIEGHLNVINTVLSIAAVALGESIQMTILLHFLETTPSILRPTCLLLVTLPMEIVAKTFNHIFPDHANTEHYTFVPIYAYHLVIILLTLLRTRSRLPFNLYLFDLMPTSQLDENRGSDEKIMMEETAQPANLSTEKEKPEHKNSNIKEKKENEKEKGEDKNLTTKEKKKGTEKEKKDFKTIKKKLKRIMKSDQR